MNMKFHKIAIIVFLCLQSVAHAGWFDTEETKAKLAKKDEPDHLTLAALMIRDGHYDRAETILLSVNKEEDGFNAVKYYTLKGLIHLNQGKYEPSEDAFLKAIQSTSEVDPILYVYIAQAYYASSNFERTLWALNGAGDYISTMPDLLGVKATCHWSQGNKSEAFAVLINADQLFPERSDFKIRQIYYLIEMTLYKEAAIESENFLSRFGAKAESYLIVGEAMRRSKNEDQALFILEKGHLRYPANQKMLLSLAHTYMQSGKNIAAARLFEKSAAINPEYLQQAIGLYRMVGDTWRAKFLNAQVTDTKQKLKNWMEILLVEESYEEILAIEERLVRYGILKDDKLRYAMAYVHFISENYDTSESFLKGISDPQVFKNSIKLLEAIELVRSRREKT